MPDFALHKKAGTMMEDHTIGETTLSQGAASVIGGVAVDVKATVAKKVHETVSGIKSQASDAKVNMAGEVKNVAASLRRESEQLRGGSAQQRTMGQIASGLADTSDALRDRNIGEIMRSVRTVARENPILFLGGAALLGFAASRFANASSSGALHHGALVQTRHEGNAFGFVHNDQAD